VSVLPRVLERNWRLKLSALALSVFLWAVVTIQPRNRQVLSAVPVQVDVSDPGWTLVEASPATVTVQLGVSSRELLQLPRGSSDIAIVRVPVELVTGRDTLIRLRPDWVILGGGSGLIVESITPPTVAIRFEPTVSTALPLSLGTTNELSAELAFAQPMGLNPAVIRVHGPQRVVEALDSVALEPLDLSSLRESGLYRVPVDTSGLSSVTLDPTVAQVAIQLEPAVEREIVGIPVVVEPPTGVDPASLVVDPPTIQVRLLGVETLVSQVHAAALAAVVVPSELNGLAPGQQRTVPIRLRGVPHLVRAFSAVDSVRVTRNAPAGVPR
jgi:YbbR domain-containing protein